MTYNVIYVREVKNVDIPKLSSPVRDKIKKAIEQKLMSSPEQFAKPLRRSLKGYRKLRVGNFRVVFRIEGKTVKIFAIRHRSDVYIEAGKRLA
ncbi:MAG: type II toxin-antitoxin system RelE/ParE family toxin [Candidatus Peregrinibacteria bacterium]|nr:type II toxin-antitoxin system RelE/ParE family toxin [Candidatus Peregrinibacteria bacterium]